MSKWSIYTIELGSLLLIFFIFIFCLALPSHALTITLEWDANTELDLSHYIVFWGNHSGIYTSWSEKIYKPKTTYALDITGEPYYFAVKAYDNELESEFSNEVSINVPSDNSLPIPSPGDAGGGGGGCFVNIVCY